jgi:transposase
MFFLEGQVRVFLYGQPVNMRLWFDGLYALAKHVMQDPLSGNLFAFINRRATPIRVLYFDRSGLCVWVKRLEQGRLVSNWANVTSYEMDQVSVSIRHLSSTHNLSQKRRQTGTTRLSEESTNILAVVFGQKGLHSLTRSELPILVGRHKQFDKQTASQ